MSLRYSKMLRAMSGLLVLGSSGLALFACTTTTGAYTYGTETDFCTALAQAKCQPAIVGSCYGSGSTTAPPAADTEACIKAASAETTCNPLALPYHPELADICVASTQKVYALGAVTRPDQDQLDLDCLPVFNKGLPEGARCSLDKIGRA